ncbi:hypothetical protein EAH86_10470 [Pedococcus bigeumensis]|uniref:Uncharacterized protein n=2 Tax=Pedococcus bigeumensis TaxID=433644 RepID=A0A502CW87_9MICO|nr:hypothetical protein EAH86_10470 [Pedococcus bigeumensis]
MASIQSILAEEGSGLAEFYVLASQYTHAAELATRSSRADLGTDAAYGDFAGPSDWLQPVWMAWLSFRVTAVRLINLSGSGTPEALALVDHQVTKTRDALVTALQTQGEPLR